MKRKDLNNWFMYYEIHKLRRMGFSIAKIAHYLEYNERTVSKYLNMNEQQYEQFLIKISERDKLLDKYETFVSNKLCEYQDTSTAQIHDWLKENHPDFPQVSPRTVYNYVMFIRQKYSIPLVPKVREYFPVIELPYGEQGQIDFGEYNMVTTDKKRKKVKFFVMVLSRSRMKFVWFQDKSFTSDSVIQAHEKAFAFYNGIPRVLVYDQDRTIIVDENIGDIILTAPFKQYTKSRNFQLHFCRKSDPESKGKVENVVQYVKKNFLYNRTYYDINNLNDEAIAWLARTANFLEHNYTKKSPESEFRIEQKYLNHFTPLTIVPMGFKEYYVKKTNIISYSSNFYRVPGGTYQGSGSKVLVKENNGFIEIYNMKQELLCSHQRSFLKGQTIGEQDRHRDTSKSVTEMMDKAISHFTDKSLALKYINELKSKYPRYLRDHLMLINKTFNEAFERKTTDKSLEFCIKNDLYSGSEFRDVYYCILDDTPIPMDTVHEIILLDKDNQQKVNETPQMSNINDYEIIINQ